jgi:phosphatidylglycerophosphate synthase
VVLILLTMFGSLATSYVRARAEGVGETCTVGLLQRTERVLLLAVGALIGGQVLLVVLAVLAVLTVATTVQRIVHVARKLPGPEVRS